MDPRLLDPEEQESGEFQLAFVPGDRSSEREAGSALRQGLGLSFTPTVAFEDQPRRRRTLWSRLRLARRRAG